MTADSMVADLFVETKLEGKAGLEFPKALAFTVVNSIAQGSAYRFFYMVNSIEAAKKTTIIERVNL